MFLSLLKKLFQILGLQYILNWLGRIKIFPSGILLLLVNSIPIFGVLLLDWNAFDIVFLYWIENIVIGICTIPRILFAQKNSFSNTLVGEQNSTFTVQSILGNIFLSGFFVVHYGLFTFVHGIFLLNFVARRSTFFLENNFTGIQVFFLALLISHGFSLIANYFIKEEYEHRNATEAMMKPYPRVFVIHLTIIFGAIISQFLPNIFIILFILIKTFFDLGLHLKSHYNSSPKYSNIITENSRSSKSLDLSGYKKTT
jgi:hypothetical protein